MARLTAEQAYAIATNWPGPAFDVTNIMDVLRLL